MDEFEQQIEKSLSRLEPADASKHRDCREESVKMFENRIRNVRRLTVFFLVVDIAAMVAAAIFLQLATSTRMMIWCAIMFMVAFEGTVLIKLWYYVVSSRISVLRELKHLETLLTGQLREKEQ
jgi:Family of unknown function (DUF6768)